MTDSKYVYHVTSDNFDALVLKASYQAPVLVDFWAAWCGPCQMLMPMLDHLAEAYAGKFAVAKVNTDEHPQLAVQYGIRSLPTVKVFRDGKVVDQFMGVQSEGVIRQIIDRHIAKPSDRLRHQARDALRKGNTACAVEWLRQAADMEPEDHSLKLELAAVLMQGGAAEQAKGLLDALPLYVRESANAKALVARWQFINAIADAPDASSLARHIEVSPDDLKARYQLAAHSLLAGEFEEGLEQLLEIMRRDRKFANELGRKGLVAAFAIVPNAELVNRYRQQMSALLF